MTTHFQRWLPAMALGSVLASVGQMTLADADIGVQPSGTPVSATTNVDLTVIVPEILVFGLGAVGDAIAEISWTLGNEEGVGTGNDQTYSGSASPFTAPSPYDSSAAAAIEANGGTGSSATSDTATLPVFLFSNNGSDVTITASISGGVGGGGAADVLEHATASDTIDIADFTAGQTGSILHPDISAGSGETADTANTGGIVNLAGSWTYQYTPAGTPVAGEYNGRVSYVAAQP